MKRLNYIIGLLCTILLFSACGEEEEKIIVPGYPNFKVDINVLDKELRTAGNMKIFTQPRLAGESVGYSGLLVVSNLNQENGLADLSAYDICCPNEKEKETKVSLAENGKVVCNKCKKEYDAYYGGYESSNTSSSKLRLQPYTVRRDANNTVFYIYR